MELFDILVGTVSVNSHVSIASLLIESSFLALTTVSRPHISGHFDDTMSVSSAYVGAAGLLVRVFGFHEVLSMALLNFQQVLPERHRVSPNKSILSLLASASLLQVLDFFRMGLQVAP